MKTTMNRNRNLISMRQRRILRELNREIQMKKAQKSAAWQRIARIMTAVVAFLIVVAVIVLMEIKAENDAWARVLRRTSMAEALQETTQAEEVPPDAIWASDATYAPVEGITMVEPVPIETEPEVDEEELYMLAHLLAGECQSYSRECQVAVASVVMNRVKHPSYPNSVEGVIFQHGQYACVRDGNYDREPTALNWEVAEEVLRYGSQIPVNVVFQAQFKQGPCWKKIDGEYFCIIER